VFGSTFRYAPKPRIQAGNSRLTAMLESVLIGHEDWVHSVAWQPVTASGRPQHRPCLLSASMDRTMMLWRPDAATGSPVYVWLTESRGVVRHTAHGAIVELAACFVMWEQQLNRSVDATGLWMSEESVGDAGASHLGYFR
jgi:WD40 repeat protein